MTRFSWSVALVPLFAACSILNAPDDVTPGTTSTTGGGGEAGATSSTTTSSTTGTGGQGGGTGGAGGDMTAECGNDVLELNEECDDGNTMGGDACSADCKVTEFDVEIDPSVGNEWPGIGLSKAGGDGSFFVVWRFLGVSANEIRGRAYTPTGLRVTQSPVKISTSTSPGQARIGTNHEGRSVVAWQGYDEASVVKYRVIEPDATAVDVVDQAIAGAVSYSLISVGASSSGELGMAWLGPNPVGAGYLATTRTFDTAGSLANTVNQNLSTTDQFTYPGIWGLDSGFVASFGTDDGKLGSFQLDSMGVPIGSLFSLAANANYNQDPFGVWVGPAKQFVAVYSQLVDLGAGLKSRVSMRPFMSPGNSAVLDTLVSVTDSDQYSSRVARHSSGRYVVVWADYQDDGVPETIDCDIYARVFDANGTPAAPEFLVNQVTTNCQSWPGVAVNDAGDAMFVWDNYDPPNQPRISGVLMPRLLAN